MVAVAPSQRRALTLLIDNYDSYTYNIFQMLAEVNGLAPIVVKNDDFGGRWSDAWAYFQQQAVSIKSEFESNSTGPLELVYNVVVSPGPGHPAEPRDFGMCADAIRDTSTTGVALFGVCLGHQGLAQVYGGEVVNAPEVMHGRTSRVVFDGASGGPLFQFIPSGFDVVRYHSLVVEPTTLPKRLKVTARTQDEVIMALQHCEQPQFGVQFHPEAVCSEFGYQIFQNFRDVTLGVSASKCALKHGNRSHLSPIEKTMSTIGDAETSAVEYQVLVERVATGVASLDFAQCMFSELFGNATRSFWLDSSNYVDGSAEPTPAQASVRGRQSSRFSFMGDGTGPLSHCIEFSVLQRSLRIHHSDGNVDIAEDADVFSILRSRLAKFQRHETVSGAVPELPFNFRGGYVGYLGYELLQNGLEDNTDASADTLRTHLKHKLQEHEYVPDASLLFADRVVVFDHQDSCVYTLSVVSATASETQHQDTRAWHSMIASKLMARAASFNIDTTPRPPTSTSTVVFHPSRSRDQYLHDIAEVQKQIHDGETYEVCLTNQLKAKVSITEPLAFYNVLRKRNPAPYAGFYLSNPDNYFNQSSSPSNDLTTDAMETSYAVCCSSPERFLRVERDGWMESKPIKGTRRRGQTASEDAAIIDELAYCVKDRAENMMIADLVRNDFGRVAQIGSVHVPQLMKVESYATVHQLVTTVRAKRSANADLVDVIDATFPGGSMTGAPKKRTMQIIRSLEKHPRGVYSGALGFLSIDGSCDLNIIIRTALITKRSVSLGSGGAIVALSDFDDEYDEMLLKTKALVQAIGAFVTGRDDGTGAIVATTTTTA